MTAGQLKQVKAEDHTVVQVDQSLSNDQLKKKNLKKETLDLVHLWQHKATVTEVLSSSNSNGEKGLSTTEALFRIEKHGHNKLTEIPATPWWRDLIHHFTDLFSLLLQFAAILSLIVYLYDRTDALHLYLFVFLYSVVVMTSLFTFIQKRRSDRTLREFQNFLPPKAVVIRDGSAPMLVNADRLAVGDIVRITAGDRIPADVRIVQCDDTFAVDCAVLTGESTPVALSVKPCDTQNALEAINLAFFGCFAIEGTCKAVVIATGDSTVFGRIAALTANGSICNNNSEKQNSTLERDIEHFVVCISLFSVIVGVVSFLIGVALRVRIVQNVIYTLGIIVSNIPEGLVATVTVALTACARRMVKRNVIIKRLDAVETLGTTDVIVTDKTGTLTKAIMSVAHAAFGGTVHTVADKDWVPPGKYDRNDPNKVDNDNVKKAFSTLLHGASVCSTAYFESMTGKSKKDSILGKTIRGDASETGVLRFTERQHDTMAYRSQFTIKTKIPFNSLDKLMVTVDNSQDKSRNIASTNNDEGSVNELETPVEENEQTMHGDARLVMKGAPESVLEHCDSILSVSGVRPLTKEDRQLIDRQIEHFAQLGERILAYAEKCVPFSTLESNEEEDTGDLSTFLSSSEKLVNRVGKLCFMGLLSLTDPPRDGVPDAIQSLKAAGIRIMMVTGDHAETAVAVAQTTSVVTRTISQPTLTDDGEFVIPEPHQATLIHGSTISSLTDTQWETLLSRDELIFARASPQHKLEIVRRLQSQGHVVTATGDGCNDAPALKAANAGVAMGCTGSDVSRSVADIVLLDDNICNIVHGVREGRLVFDNLKKSVAYTLTSNVPQLLPFLAFIILRLPLPITTALVLCVDLGTDVFPAIALAYEGPERDLLRRAPRAATGDRLLTWRLLSFSTIQLGLLQTFAGVIVYLVVFADTGLAPSALPGLARHTFFGSIRPTRQRWMLAVQSQAYQNGSVGGSISTGTAFEARFFSRNDMEFVPYFSPTKIPPGFEHMSRDDFRSLRVNSAAFQNMLKIVGAVQQRPPCAAYFCRKTESGIIMRNDITCFAPTINSGPVMLERPASRNDAVVKGRGAWEGCFELWTPKRQRRTLRTAQTAFFVAVVVAQMFTLFACRTRVVSVIPRLFKNGAIWLALLAELIVVVVIVYVPPVAFGLHVVPLTFKYWLPAIPFGVLIVVYDEARKWFIRRHVDNESGLIIPKNNFIDRTAKWVHDYTYW